MLNLIKYNLFRFIKQKSTYVFLVLNIILSVGIGISTSISAIASGISTMSVEASIILSGILISLFFTTEFKDGMVRNQIIIGNSHKRIFIADSLSACIIGCVMWISNIVPYIITISVVGINLSALGVVLGLLAGLLSVCCACCLYVFISFLTQNAHGIIICMVLSAVLCIFASLMTTPLAGGSVIKEPLLTILLTCARVLPISQLTFAETFSTTNIWIVFVSAIAFTAIFEIFGTLFFKNSDLK